MKLINITSRSASFELLNETAYYAPNRFLIYLNGKFIREEEKNIFTIFDLNPNTNYTLNIGDKKIDFTTKTESCCLHIKSFNTVGDGYSDDTVKIQAAIACAPKGATIYFDEGTYLISSIFLKSDIMLYIPKTAKIVAKTKRMDFPVFPGLVDEYNFGVWEGSEVNNFASIINGISVENVCICGEGELDCNAEAGDWYVNHRVMNIAWRGHAAFFNRCKNISMIGVYVHDTQSWAIHPYFTQNIVFINVHIKNNPSMPTTDGIDPDCCDGVQILGCIFDVGDDCIAIKSGTFDLAKKYRTPCSNIYISNNLMNQGHGGVVFGSESSGGINNVTVERCVFNNTDRGLRIKTRRGRGNIGKIDNVLFNDIIMNGVKTPFVINMYYNMGPAGGHEEYVWTTKPQPFDERTPVIGHFKFSNMKCYNVGYAAGVFLGLPESKIEKLEFENVKFTYDSTIEEGYPTMIEHNFKLKNAGLYCFNVDSVIQKDVQFKGVCGEKLIEERSDL